MKNIKEYSTTHLKFSRTWHYTSASANNSTKSSTYLFINDFVRKVRLLRVVANVLSLFHVLWTKNVVNMWLFLIICQPKRVERKFRKQTELNGVHNAYMQQMRFGFGRRFCRAAVCLVFTHKWKSLRAFALHMCPHDYGKFALARGYESLASSE